MSRKNKDINQSRYFEQFLVDLLNLGDKWKFNEDKQKNINGIDGWLLHNNRKVTVDIKFAKTINYTKCFELDFLNKNGEVSQGWLINNNLTDLYIYADSNFYEAKQKGLNTLSKVEIFFLTKKTIINWLNENNIDFLNYADLLESHGIQKYDKTYYYFNKDVYLCYSSQLVEQPVNLLIIKKVLKEIALKHLIFENVDCKDLMNQTRN